MSPPIRDGSGNSIGSIRLGDGTEIAEVRTGAGDVVFSGGAIPDSVVDNFEDNDLTEYTDTSDFSIVSTDVLEGSHSLSIDSPPGTRGMYSLSGDGLDYYPQKGDKFSVLLKDPSAQNVPGFNFGLFDDSGSILGYEIVHFPSEGTYVVYRLDQGSVIEIGSRPAIGLSNSILYDYEVQWHNGSGSEPDDTIELTIYEVDDSATLSEELGRTSQVHNVTLSDSTHPNGRGIGWANASSTVDGTGRMDRYWHLGDVE
jgi:hypothetical protein